MNDLQDQDLNQSNAYYEGEKFIHPDYSQKNLTRDFALIRLKSRINGSAFVQNSSLNSICLPKMSKVIDRHLNEYAMLVGWGVPEPDMRLSVGYAKINVEPLNNETDNEFNYLVISKKLDNIQICGVGYFNLLTNAI